MNKIVTQAIILSRTNYGEADRIITILTPDNGKVTLMSKGVRRINSKLAGGIELFCLSEISYLVGRGDMGRLISSRLVRYFDNIVRNIDRTMYGYDVIKLINKITEDLAGNEYFNLLRQMLAAINDDTISLEILKLWFGLQLLKLTGHTPNLVTDSNDNKLDSESSYGFSVQEMTFETGKQFSAKHIKLLRLGISLESPTALSKVNDIDQVLADCLVLVKDMTAQYLRV